jgi:acyl carrier protein phosphodiesterase
MTFEQLAAILAFLTTILGGVGTWLSRSYFPHKQRLQEAESAEAAKHRDHEREMAKAKALAEMSGESNIWQQMVNLQTKLMNQNEEFSSFIIHLATERADSTDRNARDDMRQIAERWTANSHELREVRTSLSILVQEAATRERDRESLKKLPAYILDLIARQEVFYAQVQEFLNGNHKQVSKAAGNDD